MEHDVYKVIARYALYRLKRYRHDANQRGDTTQAAQIQADREFITRLLVASCLMDEVADLGNGESLFDEKNVFALLDGVGGKTTPNGKEAQAQAPERRRLALADST